MWLARQRTEDIRREAPSEEGTVTVGGEAAGVYLEGERRNVPVFAPGGFCWKPTLGQTVLVLKAGEDGEQPCVVGSRTEDRGLEPGEAALYAGGGEVRLKQSGEVALTGTVTVNGVKLEDLIRQIAATMIVG